jgi:hypothetical protein
LSLKLLFDDKDCSLKFICLKIEGLSLPKALCDLKAIKLKVFHHLQEWGWAVMYLGDVILRERTEHLEFSFLRFEELLTIFGELFDIDGVVAIRWQSF